MKHNEYSVRVRTEIDGEQYLDTFIIGPDREYKTLNELYEDLCKHLQLAIDHFEIIVDSSD